MLLLTDINENRLYMEYGLFFFCEVLQLCSDMEVVRAVCGYAKKNGNCDVKVRYYEKFFVNLL